MIVTLHGLGGTHTTMMRPNAIDLAEAGGYILLAPMGYNPRGWFGAPAPQGRRGAPPANAAPNAAAPNAAAPNPAAPNQAVPNGRRTRRRRLRRDDVVGVRVERTPTIRRTFAS